MPTPIEVVTRFCDACGGGDVSALGAFFAEDAVYHNIPMDPVTGRDGILTTLAAMTTGVDEVEFEVLQMAQAAGGTEHSGIVLTERIDRFVFTTHTIALPVMGTFEVVDGQITAWRDYFDLDQFMTQLAPPAE